MRPSTFLVAGLLLAQIAGAQSSRLLLADSAISNRVSLLPPPQQVRPLKDPALAGILSFVLAGSGQVYTGKVGKGLLIFIGTGVLVTQASACLRRDSLDSAQEPCAFPGFGFAALAVGTWLWGVFTAPGDANEYNYRTRSRNP